jgi:DNA-binding SARP family transcriptional activator
MFELKTLGGLALCEDGSKEVLSVLAQPKRFALLCYLAIARPRGGHRRDRLISLFWPERDARRARKALNQAVYSLRQSLGERVVVSRGDDDLSLDWELFTCDVDGFRTALREGALEHAMQLYRGPLLTGFHVAESFEFERWSAQERQTVHYLAFDAAAALATSHEKARDVSAAIRWAATASSIAPFDEKALRHLMHLLDATGNRARALCEFEAFETRLQEALDLAPSRETKSLATEIRMGAERTSAVGIKRAPGRRPPDSSAQARGQDLEALLNLTQDLMAKLQAFEARWTSR